MGDLNGNRAAAVAQVEAAAAQGARLVVLPELASSGYVFSGEEEAGRLDPIASCQASGGVGGALVALPCAASNALPPRQTPQTSER
ncbi:MAG: hypothetical protein ABSB36_03605, partial [Candidatus Dormibacteria bacterium]